MGKIGLFFILIIVAVASPSERAHAATDIGKIIYASGSVWVQRGSVKERAERGRALFRHDVIVTGRRGRAKLEMVDGSRVYVGSRSRIGLAEYATRKRNVVAATFNMFWGKARFFVNKLMTRSSKFQVRTSTAVLGVRGTSFFVHQPVPQPRFFDSPDIRFEQFIRQVPLPTRVVLTTGRVDLEVPGGGVTALKAGQTADIDIKGQVVVRKTQQGDERGPAQVVKPGVKGGKSDGGGAKGGGKGTLQRLSTEREADRGGEDTPVANKSIPEPPQPKQVLKTIIESVNRGAVDGGGATGDSGGGGSDITTTISNAKQNLGSTTEITIQPSFVTP